jgi:hypothetical protein
VQKLNPIKQEGENGKNIKRELYLHSQFAKAFGEFESLGVN